MRSNMLFRGLCILKVFLEHRLWVEQCAGHWQTTVAKTDGAPAFESFSQKIL